MKRQLLAFMWAFIIIGNAHMDNAQVITKQCIDLQKNYDSIQKEIQNLNTQMYMSQQKVQTLADLHDQAEDLLEQMQKNNCFVTF